MIVHDIPIRIIPSRLWDEYKEPDIPEFEVSLYLPPLKTMKTVIERLKNISNVLVSNVLIGRTTLRILYGKETSESKIRNFFSTFQVRKIENARS